MIPWFPRGTGLRFMQFNNPTSPKNQTKNMTTPLVRNSINRSPLPSGFLLVLFLFRSVAALALILVLTPAPLALADDFTTTNAREYKNATVTRIEPDGIVLKSKSGISKVYFTELPKEVQERFHYNPEKAAAAQAAYAEQAAEANKQAEELDKQRNEASKQGLQRQSQWAGQQAKQQNIQALTDRLAELENQEENLLAEIGKAEKAQEDARRRWVASGLNQPNSTDPSEANLPLLRGRLDNVRDEKQRVREELNRAQRAH
jgi:hypothetical protein